MPNRLNHTVPEKNLHETERWRRLSLAIPIVLANDLSSGSVTWVRGKVRSSTMNISFENKVALVTGAASGMGLATARAFAEAGAAVALADINDEAVHSAARELADAGHQTLAIWGATSSMKPM